MSRIQFRRDTTTRWGFVNPVLAAGELGIDLTTRRFKIGDGIKSWTELEWGVLFVSDRGQANGVAPLGADGKIPAGYIDFPEPPEYTNFQYYLNVSALPEVGLFGALYLTDDGKLWVWGGGETPGYRPVAAQPDAAPNVKGVLKLTGDLGGTADLPLVKKLGGVAMPTGAPEPGQVLKAVTSSTTAWANDNNSGGGGGGGDDGRFAVFEQDIGDGTSNPITVSHMMGTRQVVASMTRKKGDCEVISIFRMKAPSINAVVIEPDMPLAVGSWRLTLVGSLGLSDITPPSEPTLSFVSDQIDKITVSASSEDPDEAGFNWFIKPTADAGSPIYVGTTTGNTFEFTGLLGSTEYDMFATTLDSAGNESVLSDPLTHETPVPVPFSYASFTTLPVGRLDVPQTSGAGPAEIVSTNKIRESTGTDGNKQYPSLLVLPNDIHTELFKVSVTNGGVGGSTNRSSGGGCASADGTKAVYLLAAGPGQGVSGRIYSWKDGIATTQASLSSVTWSGGQSLELVPSVSGAGVVTWTVWRDGAPTTLKWEDSGHLVDLPGTRACLAFLGTRTGGIMYPSPGIASMSATPI